MQILLAFLVFGHFDGFLDPGGLFVRLFGDLFLVRNFSFHLLRVVAKFRELKSNNLIFSTGGDFVKKIIFLSTCLLLSLAQKGIVAEHFHLDLVRLFANLKFQMSEKVQVLEASIQTFKEELKLKKKKT